MTELDQLRAEHNNAVIGPQIADLLTRVVVATARTYPAAYSDYGVWNPEALDDLRHQWVEERLLRRGDLAVMMASAASIQSFRAALTTSLRQFLTNRRRRTSATNLFKRIQRMLEADHAFSSAQDASRAADRRWQTSDSPSSPSIRAVRELVATAFELSDDELKVVRYGPTSLKSSPILREPDLKRFLAHLLAGAEGSLSLAQIAEVFRRRFALVEPTAIELNEALESHDAPVIAKIAVDDAASSALARLTPDTLDLLREFSASGSFSETALQLGVSRESVATDVKEAIALVAEYAEDEEEATAIYNAIIESLF